MNKAKKILSLLLCAVLLVGASIAGTVAYLTDKAEVKNTFTVGQVHIDLTETDIDNDNDQNDNVTIDNVVRDKANAYKLMPGIAVKKDPVVTVEAGSADCYVRVKVTVKVPAWNNEGAIFVDGSENALPFQTWANDFDDDYFKHGEYGDQYGFDSVSWAIRTTEIDENAKTITHYLYYINNNNNKVQVGDTDMHLVAPFTYVYPQNDLTNAQMAALAGMTIDVEAHAIQADGFVAEEGKTAEEVAWDAFESQNR